MGKAHSLLEELQRGEEGRKGCRAWRQDKAGRAEPGHAGRGGPDLDFILSAMGISAAPGHGPILPSRALGP